MNETLATTLNSLEIDAPVSHGLLHIFPLRAGVHAEADVSLLEDALRAGTLRIEELHEAGSVPELRVVNDGALRVLILEGDELIGARQDRVANSSVLVAADSEFVLPVSCVERGRWSYRSRAFSPGRGSPHLALRRLKSRSVHDSLRRGRSHRSDQRAVWREVDRKARLHNVASPTHALQDARSHLSQRLDAFEKLARELPDGTSGVVVAIGERLALLEVLAGPRTFARAFRKLLSGYAFESAGLDNPGHHDRQELHRSRGESRARRTPGGRPRAGREVRSRRDLWLRAHRRSGSAARRRLRGVEPECLHGISCARLVEAEGGRGSLALEGEARLLNRNQKATARQLSLAAYLLSSDGRPRDEASIRENLPPYAEIHASSLARNGDTDHANDALRKQLRRTWSSTSPAAPPRCASEPPSPR